VENPCNDLDAPAASAQDTEDVLDLMGLGRRLLRRHMPNKDQI
jgi:hypothetical protein